MIGTETLAGVLVFGFILLGIWTGIVMILEPEFGEDSPSRILSDNVTADSGSGGESERRS